MLRGAPNQLEKWWSLALANYSERTSGRLKTHLTPRNATETFTYQDESSGGGLLLSSNWGNTTTTTNTAYTYDTLSRLDTILQSGSVTGHYSNVRYTYDGFSRKATEAQGVVGITMTSTNFTGVPTVGYQYDSDGNLAHLVYPDGTVVDYTYTSRNQLYQVYSDGVPALATYGYDVAGRPLSLALENSVNTTTTYGTAGQLTSVLHSKAAAASFDGVTYGLNAQNDRRTGITRTGGWNDSYGYDPAGEVTSGTYAAGTTATEGFTYDATGNRLTSTKNGSSTAYNANANDGYTAIGGLTETNDDSGNLTSFNRPGISGTIAMTWDAGDQLYTASNSTGKSEKNSYDALHRRTLKRVWSGVNNTGTLEKQVLYLYDGWNIIEEREYNSATTLTQRTRYTWGRDVSGSLQGAGGVGGLLMAEVITVASGVSSTPVPHYYHYDGNGNVIALTDASGNSEGRYRYTAFGTTTLTSGLSTYATAQPYRFSTKYRDTEVETQHGMYSYGYRYYLPGIGRWPSRDPIWERGGRNVYAMCSNRSISLVDRLGLDAPGHVGGGDRTPTDGYSSCTDDAGRNCCCNAIQEVELRSSDGHSFLSMPNGVGYGHYPVGNKWQASWVFGSSPGEVPGHDGSTNPDDGTHNPPHDYDPEATKKYKACPETLSKLQSSIDNHRKDPYTAGNIAARNCTGWACSRLEDSGIKPPFAGNSPGLHPSDMHPHTIPPGPAHAAW